MARTRIFTNFSFLARPRNPVSNSDCEQEISDASLDRDVAD
jgi:hypothetical protein